MNGPKKVCRACIFGAAFLAAAVVLCIIGAIWLSTQDACPAAPGLCMAPAWIALVFLPLGVLLVGSASAAVLTFRIYRTGGEYQQWHIVMWLLLICMVTYAGFAMSAWAGT